MRTTLTQKFLILFLISTIFYVVFSAPFLLFNKVYLAFFSKSAIIQKSFLLLFFFFLLFKLIKDEYKIFVHPLSFPLVFFLIWALISCSYSINKYESFIAFNDLLFAFCFFFLTANIARRQNAKTTIVIFIFIAGFLTALIGILQHLYGLNFISQSVPPAATFANKNLATHFMVLTIPIGMIFFIKSENIIIDWLVSITLALMVSYLVYTTARAGWIAFIFEVIFLAIFSKRIKLKIWNKNKVVAFLVAILIVFFMFKIDNKNNYEKKFKHTSSITQGTIVLRLQYWKGISKLIKHNFWSGVGFGNLHIALPYYNQSLYNNLKETQDILDGYEVKNAHNDYFDIFAETGFIGFSLFIIFIVSFLKFILKDLNQKENSIAFLSLTGISVNAFFSFPLQLPVPLFSIMILLGLTNFDYEKNSIKLNKKKLFYMLFITFIIFIVFYNFHLKNKEYKKAISKAENYYNQKKWDKTIKAGYIANTYNPYIKEEKMVLYLGNSYMNLQQYDDAIQIFKEFIERNPNNTTILLNLGNAYVKINDYKNALINYKKILYLKPKYVKALQNTARAYMKKNDFKEAKELLLKVIEIDNKNSSAFADMGFVEIKNKNFNEAVKFLLKSIEIDDKNAYPHNLLSYIFYNFGKIENALYFSQKATTLEPDNKEYANNLKIIYNTYLKEK